MGAPNELSFLPDDYLERKARRRTNAICAVLFSVVIAAIGGASFVTDKSMRQLDTQYAQVQQQYTEAAKRIGQVQKMQDKQRTMAHQAELTASLLEKVPRSFLLAEVTNGMPSGVSLLDFNLDSKVLTTSAPAAKTAFDVRQAEINANKPLAGITVAEVKRFEVSMRATGVATTDVQVAQFITKLNRSPLLKDVNLVITDEFIQKGEKLRRFQIEMTLNPDAQVPSGYTAGKDTRTLGKSAAVQIEAK